MSLPQHSVPAVSEYAPKSSVPGLAESTRPARTDSSIDSSTSGVSAAISTFHASATSTNAAGTTSTGREGSRTTRVGDVADAAVGATPDWREKDADRSARQQIARIILTLIMKSANRPTSANYNPREIARRLEHTLYMGASSKQEYSNVQTLKARLQQALDNSRRRQMQQQQARLQQLQASGTSMDAGSPTPAQLLQQRQMALLQRQQQQQMVAALHNQRTNYQAVPFPGTSAAMTQPSISQPLQMPVTMPQMTVTPPTAVSAGASTSLSDGAASVSTSILDELEREADEMANGVNDQPLSMPESEMHMEATSGVLNAGSGNTFVTSAAATPSVLAGGSYGAVPLSMPQEIGASVASSAGIGQPNVAMASAAPATSVEPNLYHGMNLTGPQLQQIQHLHQMQQLRRMQQLQQLQQQQLNGTGSAGTPLPAGATSGTSTTPAATTATGNGVALGMVPLNDVSIAQKREELKRRLIQLKHARTCTTSECAIEYCSRTKALLSHVSRCANAQCTTLGCKSTRQLLSHFRKCRNLQCDVCSAIRPPMNENEQQLVLRRQQERLCMLRHASTCSAPQCNLPYCAGMKVLWKHICECHQRQCRTDHCISSRYVLSHFKQCNKMICEVCGPVRKAIKVVDSCRGNPAQLQLAASQCPDGVRGLIKIMNTTTAVVRGGSAEGEEGGETSSGLQANIKVEEKAGADTVASEDVQTSGANGVHMKDAGVLDERKRKPLKLQSEKEKKLRRKEQAKIAKARAQAKAAATAAAVQTAPPSSTVTTDAASPMVPNGLVVRGTQATLDGEHLALHQDTSFLDSMTEGQLDEHIRSLRFNFCGHITMSELKNRLMPLLTKLMESEYGWTFNNPVDPVQWNIPDYFDIIKCPMDLGTIKKRLESEHYTSVEAFAGDVRLVFENCIAYNSSTNKFNIAAKQLLASFNRGLATLKTQLEKQLFKRCEQRREEMCQLCGGDSFKFAPCMLFCSGPCAGRIRRHTHYYSDPGGDHHWCSTCYKQMKDGPIDMSLLPQLASTATEVVPPPPGAAPFDGVLKKSSLVKRKNSEVAEEPWVECDACKLWYHQICALFNERNHAISGEQEPFVCPICVKKQRAAGVKPSMDNGLKAKRLPLTRMAKLIETRVMEAIEKAGKDEAVRMGNMGNSDSIGFSSGTKESTSETQFGITIREVLSVDKQVQVKPRMGHLLASKYLKADAAAAEEDAAAVDSTKSLKRPRGVTKPLSKAASQSLSLQLTYRSRCICVFQELDGVDVLIFTLYVQEYGPDALAPNAGRVYVSYLDSVNYFQPKKLRTLMHQQVMLGFLEDCKNRGFHTCHIWSCPPLKGDDYIFFCKPENQKIPKSARLRQWYQKLLVEAKKDGLVANISNLYAEYYLKKKAAHELPYFEGDYWPRLAEDLMKQLEEKEQGTRTKAEGAEPSETGTSPPAKGPTTPLVRSPSPSEASQETPLSQDAGTASMKSALPPSTKTKSKRQVKEPVTMEPSVTRSSASSARSIKSTTVSRASSSSKTVVNPDPLMQKLKGILEPQKDDFFVVDLHPKCHKCSAAIVHESYWEFKTLAPSASVQSLLDAAKKLRASSSSARTTPPRHYQYYYCRACYATNKTQLLHRVDVSRTGAKRAEALSERLRPLHDKAVAAELADLDVQELKYEAVLEFVDPMDARSAPNESKGTEDEEAPTPEPRRRRVIGDDLDDVIMPCEIFDTREAFLLYCQNSHCQFDQIRRAKHSSMMVLYHMFNQGTTGFTFSCSACKTTLRSGNRWNCSICPVFNLCDACHVDTKHEHPLHLFKVVPIPTPGTDPTTSQPSVHAGATADRERPKAATDSTKTSGRKRKAPTPSTVETDAEATSATKDGHGAKKRRIHNVDPQLLLQLEHASECTVPQCSFFNCTRMQAMLKHGVVCEQRLAGPCVLCKRICGLLSAHARQCTKDAASCHVPRCADIRRHYLVQARQHEAQQGGQTQKDDGGADSDAATGRSEADETRSTRRRRGDGR